MFLGLLSWWNKFSFLGFIEENYATGILTLIIVVFMRKALPYMGKTTPNQGKEDISFRRRMGVFTSALVGIITVFVLIKEYV